MDIYNIDGKYLFNMLNLKIYFQKYNLFLVKTFLKTEVERKRFFPQNEGFERKIKYLIVYSKKPKSQHGETQIPTW